MVLSLLLVAVGFVLLIFGANWLVDGGSLLAKKYRVSDLAIGLTIIAFGTSAPELVVNLIASTNGYSDIILGNIIGSNNFNLFIILGITGMIMPITVKTSTSWREIPVSLFVAVLLLLLANNFYVQNSAPELSRIDGIIMLVLFVLFLYYVFTQLRSDHTSEHITSTQKPMWQILGLIIIGLAGLVSGGKLVVTHSVAIATELGVSEKIIGLTIVAAGTSLPELVTSVVAAWKKNSDIAIGNVIGSNIFNILLILSVSSLVTPVAYTSGFDQDIYILIGGTVLLLLFMLTGKKKRIDRWEAALLFLFYTFYTVYLVTKEL